MEKLKTMWGLSCVAWTVMWYGIRVGIASMRGSTIYENHEMAGESYQAVLNHLNVKVKSSNLEKIVDPPAIVIGNHTTNLDIPALNKVFSPRKYPLIFMAKERLFKIPFLGKGMRELGMIKRSSSSSKETWKNLKTEIERIKEEKYYLVMYPEGTRTTLENYEMLDFKKRTFIISLEHDLPIIPVASYGGQEILPKKAWVTKPGTMKLKILQPIYPIDYSGIDNGKVNQMMEDARSRLKEGIDSLRPPKPKTSL